MYHSISKKIIVFRDYPYLQILLLYSVKEEVEDVDVVKRPFHTRESWCIPN